jgi:hypothetical protein
MPALYVSGAARCSDIRPWCYRSWESASPRSGLVSLGKIELWGANVYKPYMPVSRRATSSCHSAAVVIIPGIVSLVY